MLSHYTEASSPDDTWSVALRLVEYFNDGPVEALDELIASDLGGGHDPGPADQLGLTAEGVEGPKQFLAMFRAAFANLRFEVREVVVDNDRVAMRSVITGTHVGTFLSISPTGKPIRVEGIDILRITGGKVVEHVGVWDRLALMQQLHAS
jgi:predicted ester cyclase